MGAIDPDPDGHGSSLSEDRPADLAVHREGGGKGAEVTVKPPGPPEDEEAKGACSKGRGGALDEDGDGGQGEAEGCDPAGRPGRSDHL